VDNIYKLKLAICTVLYSYKKFSAYYNNYYKSIHSKLFQQQKNPERYGHEEERLYDG